MSYNFHKGQILTGSKQANANVSGAKKLMAILNTVGLVIMLWIFLFPSPYKLAMGIALLYPLPILLICFVNRNQFSLTDLTGRVPKNTKWLLVINFFVIPLGVLAHLLADYSLVSYLSRPVIWLPLSAIIGLMIIRMLRSVGVKIFSVDMVIGVFIAFVFAYSCCIYINCAYDDSDAETYHTKVLNKYINYRRSTTYHLEIGGWSSITSSRKISVSKQFYDRVATGSQIDVHQKKGALGIPFFYLEN